jgi:hypothetical protein
MVVQRVNERMVEGGDAGTDTIKLLRPLPLTTTTRMGAVREERLCCFMKRRPTTKINMTHATKINT